MGREVVALDRRAADLERLLRVPAVAAEQRHVDAELARLLRDQAELRVVAGHEDRVGLGGADRRELRAELDVAARVALVGDDLAAELGERLAEEIGEPDRVVLLEVEQDRHLLDLQLLDGEARHHRALERVDEAGAEDVVADLGDLRVGRAGRDHRHARALRLGRRRERARRGDLAEQRHHLVALQAASAPRCAPPR